MKRIVISLLGLSGLLGGGSAGLYFAHDKFLAAAPPEATSAEAEQAPPRDLRPMPIPLANSQPDASAPHGNPFRQAADRVTSEDRYAARQTAYDAAEETADQPSDAPLAIERDDQAAPAVRGGDPFGLRNQQDRDADAAPDGDPAGEADPAVDAPRELAPADTREAVAPADSDDEPRTLGERPAEPTVDRYGRTAERSRPGPAG